MRDYNLDPPDTDPSIDDMFDMIDRDMSRLRTGLAGYIDFSGGDLQRLWNQRVEALKDEMLAAYASRPYRGDGDPD